MILRCHVLSGKAELLLAIINQYCSERNIFDMVVVYCPMPDQPGWTTTKNILSAQSENIFQIVRLA